ncbi:Hint domain-containing protein [Paracoccus luteus]|uniref:Hint domain-containing protein n=1 Tax=Paracoccus luteus TaxID=2508543 RepID=UPI001FE3109E|nr:Hint domain-containing protein [Paracoccus luteus]
MFTIYNASILLDGMPAAGELIVPMHSEMIADGEMSRTLPGLTVQNVTAGRVSRGDTITVKDVDYKVANIHWVDGVYELGNGFGSSPSTVLTMTGGDGTTLRLWVPIDGYIPPGTQVDPKAGQLFSYQVDNIYPEIYIPADMIDTDERVFVMCFASGTMIETADGPRPVQRLRVGDLIVTRDHGLQPLRWLGGRRLDGATLQRQPQLVPVRIAAGALGRGLPAQDLVVSPQHRILIRSSIAQRMAGSPEVLVPAIHLLDLPGVDRAPAAGGVAYWHLMFDAHEIVLANGAEAESLYAGPAALAAMDPAARDDLLAIFPDLAGANGDERPTARPVLPGRRARKMVERAVRNDKPLVSAPA